MHAGLASSDSLFDERGRGDAASPDLTGLRPAADAYALLPIADAFDWDAHAAPHLAGEWYLVVFRSIRREVIDEIRLTNLDDAAHEEAASAPGFIHYFKGPLAADLSCMSFCMWNSRADARAAAGLPAHRAAVIATGEAYESYALEFVRVTKDAGERHFGFESFDHPTH
jgi:hypothetical protein